MRMMTSSQHGHLSCNFAAALCCACKPAAVDALRKLKQELNCRPRWASESWCLIQRQAALRLQWPFRLLGAFVTLQQ
jgi:hypothetical protein